MEVRPLKQTSKKRTSKDGSSHSKHGRKIGDCECNSASEMCGKTSSSKGCSCKQSSRACAKHNTKASN